MDERMKDPASHRITTLEHELAACRAEARQTAKDLGERVKELTCLYAVASLLQPSTPAADALPEVLQSLVFAYQYPEVTLTRIRLEDQVFCSDGFHETAWRQAAELTLYNETIGMVEVYYAEERPPEDEGPFLKEERRLIDTVALLLSRYVQRERAQEDLFRREQEFETLAETSPDIIARLGPDGRIMYINPTLEKFTGRDRTWFLGKRLEELGSPPEEAESQLKAVQSVLEQGEEYRLDHTYPTLSGRRYFHSSLVPEFSERGEVISILVVTRDITDMKRVQQTLEDQSMHDPLTGVANRRYLDLFIEREWRNEARHRHTIAIIMADIDYFKIYNDHYGHQQGDKCLQQVAQALELHLRRPGDLLARFGGEEFLIVLLETGLAEAQQIAEAMREEVETRALRHGGSPASEFVTVSFGVVAAPAQSQNFQMLLTQADRALYRAKQLGRNRVVVDIND